MKENLQNLFFHKLPMDGKEVELSTNDAILILWVFLIPLTLWLIRFAYKSIRKKSMVHQNTKVDLCRDIFLDLGGFEYLIIIVILSAIYLGFWAYYTNPFSANWMNWETWVIVLPQISLILTIIVLFFIRYTKFRKPYIK